MMILPKSDRESKFLNYLLQIIIHPHWIYVRTNSLTSLTIIIFVLISIHIPLHASDDQSTLVTVFNKGLDNDMVECRLRLRSIFANGRIMTCNETISLKLHQVSGYSRQLKVDQGLLFEYVHPIGNRLMLLTNASLKRFYDLGSQRSAYSTIAMPEMPMNSVILNAYNESNTSSLITDINTYYITQGLKYNYNKESSLSGAVGPLFDRRRSVGDNGYYLKLRLSHELEGLSLSADGWLERLKAGSEHGLSTDFAGEYSFAVGGQYCYEASFQRNEHGEYDLISGNRGYRRDEVFKLSNHLTNDKNAPFRVNWDSDLSNQVVSHKGLSHEYKDSEFTWQNEISTDIILSNFPTGLSAGLDIQEQRYDDAVAQGRRNYFSLESTTAKTVLDSVTIHTRIIKYRYDTPDINDSNDRDELRYLISFNGVKKLTPEFGFLFKIKTNLHHLVYIDSKRSAENRWTRIFALSCELPWQNENFSNKCNFSVASTYTIYDFPDSDTDLSRVYRFFTAEDTLSIDLSRSFRLDCRSALLLDEHGRFSWTEWKEDVSEDGYSFSASLIPVYHNGDVILGAGWEVHHRYSWQHLPDGEKVIRESVISNGPVINLKSRPAPQLMVEMSSSVLHVKDRFRGSYNLPEINCCLTWTF